MAVTLGATGNHRTIPRAHRREQRSHAVAFVVVGHRSPRLFLSSEPEWVGKVLAPDFSHRSTAPRHSPAATCTDRRYLRVSQRSPDRAMP